MFTIPENFSSATKANFDAQLAMMTNLTNKAFEGVEKFVALNMNTAKASLEESTAIAKQLMAAKDPQEFFALTSAQAQPATEKVMAYSRKVINLATSTQAAFAQAAEEQMTDTNQKVMSLVEEVTKHAPVGSENVVAMVKSMMGNASASYEQVTKTSKQAIETLESNVESFVTQFSQAAEKSVSAAKK